MVMATNSFAQVLANKGPVFKAVHTSQTNMIPSYMLFNRLHKTRNDLVASKLELLFYKNLFFNNDDFKLPHALKMNILVEYNHWGNRVEKIEDEVLSFKYKDPVTNEYEEWDFLEIDHGLCAGFTYSLRKFHYFATFRPDLVSPFDKKLQKIKWDNYYKDLIDKIFRNEPAVFPEFASLKRLSNSSLGQYIQRHVADQWALQNIKWENFRNWALPIPQSTVRSLRKLKNELDFYLFRNFQPIIYEFDGMVPFSWYAHVLRVLDVSMDKDNCLHMKLLEPNGNIYSTEDLCPGGNGLDYEIAPDERLQFTDFYRKLAK